MPTAETQSQPIQELDVRPLRKPDKHPTIFAAYADLSAGQSFVLVNDHDPKHLRDEFEADHAGSYQWDYLTCEPRNWRVQITKLASTPLPRTLTNTNLLAADVGQADVTGAVWRLDVRDRDLDSNIIALGPGQGIDSHTGPELDVLIHVLAGSGQLVTELDNRDLIPGGLVWLPRRAERQFIAGPEGLRYLTVHQRRQALLIDTSRTAQ